MIIGASPSFPAASPQRPDAGPASARALQPAAPAAAAHAATSHPDETAKLRKQPPSLRRAPGADRSHSLAPSTSPAVPLPPKLRYDPGKPSHLHQSLLTVGVQPRGRAGEPQQHGEPGDDGRRRRAVRRRDDPADAAEHLSVFRIGYVEQLVALESRPVVGRERWRAELRPPRGCCSSVLLAHHPWASSSTISPNLRTSLVSGFHLPRGPFLVESPKTKCIIWANNSLILFLENGAARRSSKLSFLKYICSAKRPSPR